MTLIYLIAGEASGDILGGRLMSALRAARPDLAFAGIGGPAMQALGLNSLFAMNELALMGLAEILPKILRLHVLIRQTIEDIAARKPDMVVTIDSPGFCLRILDALRGSPIRRVHYVAPQVWAWRENRVKSYPGLWDELLCLLPFEPAFFARHGIQARFVGHPVLESGADRGDAARFAAQFNMPASALPLLVMPGSRRSELARLMPVFGETIHMLHETLPALVPILAAAPNIADEATAMAQTWPVTPLIVSAPATRYDAFAAARAALTKSGTSTLELALAGVPMIVAYKVNPLTALMARRLIKVPYASIVNLLSNAPILPEFIQQDCNAPALARSLMTLLDGGPAAQTQKAAMKTVLDSLQAPQGSPSQAAAASILALL
ncbi:MAG: lipid-A-disaccharide synthase [Rhodospirillales bacterium 20-60-12]|nr:MAG: lipid-A-disaccharide synthase [Rhodospirillales bacterium 20-60-12]HQT66590.1 lipid-A-disaccharide synthase [Acetobacteraceae bacterium]HQU02507.1 lipid-A-disaccharide synthase [Acetobacteraceae bacterium]